MQAVDHHAVDADKGRKVHFACPQELQIVLRFLHVRRFPGSQLVYYTKIQKFGMLTITGIIGGIFFYLIGYGWIGLLGWVLGGILSDVVLKIGGYQKFKVTVLSYACFCLGIMGCPANLWFAGEAYWENIHTSMGDQYANTLQSLMPSWMLYVGFALLFVGGILGALLGHKMLKKHFERAGIV